MFFPRGARKAPLLVGALSRKPRWATAMAFCVLLAVALTPLVDWLSFRQGRWAGEPRPSSFEEWEQWTAGESPRPPQVNPNYDTTAKGVVFGLFPDRLQLGGKTIVGEAKLEEIKKEVASRRGGFVPTIELYDRDLQAADFSGADLRGVNLDGTVIRGANLMAARLDEASLGGAQLQGADLTFAQLQGADLSSRSYRALTLLRRSCRGPT